jgi:hypothetical protein
MNAVLADLQQEISAGSNAAITGGGPIYVPKAPATMVPASAGSSRTSGIQNLVKRSAFGQPFYPVTNYDGNGSMRAINLLSAAVSVNGRFVSTARWNAPLLMAKANTAGSIDLTPVAAFTSPDWVIVAGDGSNPETWNPSLESGGTNAVLGRYAYTVYDEGGLLDMTAAGYSGSTSAQAIAYKNGLQYADVTQTGLTQAQVNAFLTARASQPITSRQGLINLLTQTIATPQTEAALQNSLQYFTHFSRDLNQPSYIPVQSVDPASPGYNPAAPAILTSAAGGNSAAPDLAGEHLDNQINCAFPAVQVPSPGGWQRNDGTLAQTGEPLVKKRFALNRLAWITSVGPIAGPTGALNPTGDANVAGIISTLESTYGFTAAFLQQGTAANIQNYFGLTWDGTSSWNYNTHNGGNTGAGSIMRVGRPLSITAPNSSIYVQDAGREPDFFDLLKAGISAGSLGKASTVPPSVNYTYTFQNFYNQYYTDVSVDCQIIQIGANIIDQFKMDNFPIHIVFNDGTGARDFYGIENLPYLYRIHPVVVKAVTPAATTRTGSMSFGAPPNSYLNSDSASTGDALATSGTITNTGLGVVMLVPELWNPHDWSGSNLLQTLGVPSVSGSLPIRVYAQTSGGTPVILMAANTDNGKAFPGDPTLFLGGGSNVSPGYTQYGFSWTGNQEALSSTSTQMTFSIPYSVIGAQLFREPTVLYEPGAPAGSGLTAPPLVSSGAAASAGLGPIATVTSIFQGQGINAAIGDLPSTISSGTAAAEIVGQSYIGMYLGTLPLIWREAANTDTNI